MRYAVIPTRTERPTLWPLVRVLLEANTTPIIVRTKPDAVTVPDSINVDGWERMSITYWTNLGLAAAEPGAPALVLNDDLGMTVEEIDTLFAALDANDLVWSRNTSPRTHSPFSGSCFGLHVGSLTMDEGYVWWHGDDDLYRRAKEAGLRLCAVDVEPVHRRAPDYERWDETMFADDIPNDQALYFERWQGVGYE